MATLPTILVDGNSTIGLRDWQGASQDAADIDEGIAAADGTEIAAATATQNRGTLLVTSFTLGPMPADFVTMDTFSYNVRWRAGATAGDDTLEFNIRVVTDSGSTFTLAAATSGGGRQNIYSGSMASAPASLTTTGATAFSFVGTTRTKAEWDDARLELGSQHIQQMGPDDTWAVVDTIEFTGTYTASAGGAGGLVVARRSPIRAALVR